MFSLVNAVCCSECQQGVEDDLPPRARAASITVTLHPSAGGCDNLGIVATPVRMATHCLVVDRLESPSLISWWNNTSTCDMRVEVGDLITRVNRVSGNAADMKAEFALVNGILADTTTYLYKDVELEIWPQECPAMLDAVGTNEWSVRLQDDL